MSLKEAYSLAHSAQCRLHMAANRPDRDLRFIVGHAMHLDSLRFRILEIESDISKSQQAKAVQFRGTGHVDQHLQKKPSTGQLGRRSPPPPAQPEEDNDDSLSDSDEDEDAAIDELVLQRYPSGSTRPPPLEPDDADEDEDSDEDEPPSPEEPDRATLEQAMKGAGNDQLANMYEGIRKCPCHGHADAPAFERMWELEGGKDGVTRVVAQIA